MAETRRMCPHCRAFITTSDRTCPYCDVRLEAPAARRRADDSQWIAGIIPPSRFLTVVILTINVGLYAATCLASVRAGRGDLMSIDGETLYYFGAKLRQAIFAGQWWRLITAGFLHGGLFHILMNSWAMMDVGAQVEELFGARRFIVIYFLSTVSGYVLSTLLNPALSIGASAGVFGLIGAMIAFGLQHRGSLGSMITGVYLRWAVYGLLIGLLPMFRIDNYAHLGGLLGGFMAAWATQQPPARFRWMETMWAVVATVCTLISVGAFVEMYTWYTAR